MNKFFILFFFLFIPFYRINSYYTNPFWIKDNKIVKISNIKLNSIIINSSLSYDFINGIRNGLFYELNGSFNISNYIFLSSYLILGENIPLLKSFATKNEFNFFSFLAIGFSYILKPFFQYNITEHNIIIFIKEIVPKSKFYRIEFIQGLNFRLLDLDIRDFGIEYRKDFLFNYFFLWSIKFLINPLYFYSIGFEIANFNYSEIFSQNYWHFEIQNYFHLPKKFSLYLNGGGGFSGSFPFAGMLNRFWIRVGVRYEIKV